MITIPTFKFQINPDSVFMGSITYNTFPFASLKTIETACVDAEGVYIGPRTMRVTSYEGSDVIGTVSVKGRKLRVKTVMETVNIEDQGIVQMVVLKPVQ